MNQPMNENFSSPEGQADKQHTHPGQLRPATLEDCEQIRELIYDLAEYEKEPEAATATVEGLRAHLFSDNPRVFAYVIDSPDSPGVLAGMAIYFLNFSTWECTHGIYLEDLYVRPEFRGRGFGKLLLQKLADDCVTHGYARLEWSVLKWNAPSIAFYKSLGAFPMTEWDTFRLTGDELTQLGHSFRGC